MRIKLVVILFFTSVLTSFAQEALNKNRKPLAEHVVLIGLDGWGSYSLEKSEMPILKSLMKQGSYDLKKRSVLPSSSAVNWASMFMGVGSELHGYTEWGSKKPELPSRVIYKNNIFPTVFQLLRDARPKAEIGVMYEWAGIKYLVDTLSLNYHAQAYDYTKNPDLLTNLATSYLKSKKPTLTGVFFDNPDHVGHSIGHNTPEYYTKLKELDVYIGKIIQSLKDAGIYEKSIIIFSSDHGGKGKGHGGKTMVEMESPFIIVGKNVRNLGQLQESIVQYDIAATIAYILGLQQPQVWTGRPVTKVFK